MKLEMLREHLDEPVGELIPRGLRWCNQCGNIEHHAFSKCRRCGNKLFRTKTITWRTLIERSPEGQHTPVVDLFFCLQRRYLGDITPSIQELPEVFRLFYRELKEIQKGVWKSR